jgi:hypothetical protein
MHFREDVKAKVCFIRVRCVQQFKQNKHNSAIISIRSCEGETKTQVV